MLLPQRVTVVGPDDLPLATRVTLVDPTGGPLITPAGGVFVWRPGAVSAPEQARFATWAETWAAAQLVKPSRIAFDQSGETSFHIPAKPGGGAWDLTDVDLDGGSLLGLGPTVFLDDGAQFSGTWRVRNVSLCSLSSLPVVEAEDGTQIVLEDGAIIRTDAEATAPFIHVSDQVTFWGLTLRYYSAIFADIDPVITADAPAFVAITCDFAVGINTNSLAGDGDFLVDDLTTRDEATRNPNISHIQIATSIDYSYG